jgi:hypothetical protein
VAAAIGREAPTPIKSAFFFQLQARPTITKVYYSLGTYRNVKIEQN